VEMDLQECYLSRAESSWVGLHVVSRCVQQKVKAWWSFVQQSMDGGVSVGYIYMNIQYINIYSGDGSQFIYRR
jgi:hypothetical protein